MPIDISKEGDKRVAGAKGIDLLCAKARKYIKENDLFLGFSVNDIKDYQSLRYASQDVEARNSAHPTAGRNHINFMYDLLRQAEPYQNEPFHQQQNREKPSILQKLKDASQDKGGQERPTPEHKRDRSPR